MRGIRYVIFWTTMAVLAGQYAVAGAGAPDLGVPEHTGPGTPGIEQVGDIQFVANIGDNLNWSGSDIEFASREVVKLSEGATGDPVCVVDQNDPEGCARDAEGNKVFQTEVRDFAILGGYGQFGRIIDVTNPAAPVHVKNTPCNISQNDIQIYGDLLLVAADGSGSCAKPDGSGNQTFQGTAVLDFSDPRNPTYLSRLTYARGSHNHTFHPGGRYVYLSDSDLASAGLGNVPIWDLADPANPVLVTDFKHLVHSPHDITFNADGSRAYAAAVTATYILNTEDPRAPTVIATIANEGISISHQSDPTPDGDFLLVSDELGGGAAGPVSSGGPVHVYDIRNEAVPVKVGTIGNDCVVASCEDNAAVHVSTSHVFRINPDGYTMAIAWYNDGVHVIDYSSIRGVSQWGVGTTSRVGARTIGRMKMPGANTWAAKMWDRHPGYVFANDINRGFDVFYVPSMGPGYLARGTIHGGHPASFFAGVGVTKTEFETECQYSPRSNGVDGWLAPVPASVADGAHTITARSIDDQTGGLYDLDMYFY
ncbi:MAG TPA: hypothetical protein VGB28_03830, partial [Actinomycetota bacterium]